MQTLRLRLLGQFFLTTSLAPDGARIGRKGRSLLASVAAHGDTGVARTSLMDLLWPHHGEEEARNALRQCLHQVRLALGEDADWLTAQGEQLQLRRDLGEVDLWQFKRLAARKDGEAMRTAAELYRGDFAEGLDADNDHYRWVLTERECTRELAHGLLVRMIDSNELSVLQAATELAHRLLAADPVHEGCYRSLMLLHARSGQGAKAVQVWEACRRSLRLELDVGPSRQTAELLERLRATLHDVSAIPVQTRLPAVAASAALVPPTPQAFDHLLRGWQLFSQFTAESNSHARAAFESALVQEPTNVDALVRVGWTHFMDWISGWSDDIALSSQCAVETAHRAIACNPEHALAHSLLGKLLVWRMEHDAGLEQLQAAVHIAPGSAFTHFHLSEALMWNGQLDAALLHVGRALDIDPNDYGLFLTIQGLALFFSGDLAAAQSVLERAVTRNPTYPWSLSTLAAVHVELGNLQSARDVAFRARQANRRLSMDFARRVLPIRRQDQRDRLAKDWLHAGFPRHETQSYRSGSKRSGPR